MPHVSINGIEKKDFDAIIADVQEKISEITGVGLEKVVLEYAPASLYICNKPADHLATVHIWWRRRPAHMQHDVAYTVGEIIKKQTGKTNVKVKYVNLDPDDLYDV
ncbi:MAG: DUF1904 family protein [Oscillospiraceae bacterium]|nr:DUF1904 family protein [Oscillospiraceae bacterium]